MRLRLLDTGHFEAALNMGVDEAILLSVADRSSPPTLRLYGWNPAAVSIGYFQGAREEVDLEACEREGVDLVRRLTGGGAVFHDAELTYSIVIPEDCHLAVSDVTQSYWILCRGVVEGLRELGLEADFAPLNDVIVGGKKISGNAQTRRHGCILQHGTIILDLDVDRMFRVLKVPKEKLRGKLIEDVKARVTSVREARGKPISHAEAVSAFVKGFASGLQSELEPGSLRSEEMRAAQELAQDKYRSYQWNFRR